MTRRIAVLAHGGFPDGAKTATGVLRYADAEVVAVLDRDIAADDPDARVADYLSGVTDAPIVASSADAPEFDALVIGIAPIGGGFDETWRADVTDAIESGADVVSGLHYFLADDPEFARLAGEHDVELWDVRRPPEDVTVAEGIARELDTEIITTVGTDCSTGKMTTTRELYEAAVDRGVDAGFIPTGQTGIIIEDWGIPIDRTVSDFTAGAVERMVRERSDHDYLFVEGQGSIVHPAYSPVTLGVLHGSMPDSLVLCHEAGREAIHGYEEFEIPNPGYVAELYESLAESVAPTEVVAGALNTAHLPESGADDAKARYRSQLTAPVADPIRDGVDELLEAVL
ncbi:DUF1611 domain-containing protein [Halosegnis longus]|uniref:DUF1611 domain-containing protein n=1 Tax=Halosegnis longus TaxID=2216012 RepID=A0AAJ4UVF8_9EURY|nr:DUF1611 domain-containing protein [Salella cibi]RNJ25910.1 DUF1611 domain-containing protein [Salella cibi]